MPKKTQKRKQQLKYEDPIDTHPGSEFWQDWNWALDEDFLKVRDICEHAGSVVLNQIMTEGEFWVVDKGDDNHVKADDIDVKLIVLNDVCIEARFKAIFEDALRIDHLKEKFMALAKPHIEALAQILQVDRLVDIGGATHEQIKWAKEEHDVDLSPVHFNYLERYMK